jgi:hypothetical protein
METEEIGTEMTLKAMEGESKQREVIIESVYILRRKSMNLKESIWIMDIEDI